MRAIHISLCGLVLSAVASCSSDTTPTVYIELAYQVRCIDCSSHSGDEPDHEIKVVDGEDGTTLTCTVLNSAGARRVTFSASHLNPTDTSSNYAFKLSGGNIDGDDTDHRYDVQVIEGANTFEGAGTTDPPSSDQPCQAKFSVKDKVISGGVYCDNIPSEADQTTTRYVVSPGTSSDPAGFKLYGCAGL